MIKELAIQNLILIANARLYFKKGFNVLSGETGSGKSAVIQALALLTGEKADTNQIRKGEEKASIEGLIDISNIPQIVQILDEAGISHEAGEDLIIRRDISSSGKGRTWINNQTVQLAVLKRIGSELLEIISQHANQKLMSVDQHRRILDIFADLKPAVTLFGKQWELELELKKKIEETIQGESKRLRDIEVCQMELEELLSAQVKEGEEESLFTEYQELVNSESIESTLDGVLGALAGEKISALGLLNRQQQPLEQLSELCPHLKDTAESFKNALLEMQEVYHTLQLAKGRVAHNPERLAEINDRLTLLNRLKKKYGTTLQEIKHYQEETSKKLTELENTDLLVSEWQSQLNEIARQNDHEAKAISVERHSAALELSKALTEKLHELNMPKAEFVVEVTSTTRNRTGDEKVEFFLVPNVGEKRIPIKVCASGGEMSRILLALQTILAGK